MRARGPHSMRSRLIPRMTRARRTPSGIARAAIMSSANTTPSRRSPPRITRHIPTAIMRFSSSSPRRRSPISRTNTLRRRRSSRSCLRTTPIAPKPKAPNTCRRMPQGPQVRGVSRHRRAVPRKAHGREGRARGVPYVAASLLLLQCSSTGKKRWTDSTSSLPRTPSPHTARM